MKFLTYAYGDASIYKVQHPRNPDWIGIRTVTPDSVTTAWFDRGSLGELIEKLKEV